MLSKNPCRNWAFTLNNFEQGEITVLDQWLKMMCKYAVYESEHTDGQGTPHLQGYFQLFKKQRMHQIKSQLFERIHLELARGTQMSNEIYCSKEYIERQQNPQLHPQLIYFKHATEGSESQQGKRNDILNVCKSFDKFVDVIDNRPDMVCKFARGLQIVFQRKEFLAQTNQTRQVLWFWGETGSGKTRKAVEFAEVNQQEYWISGRDLRWFDGYYGQPVAIIDDFRKSHCSFNFLLRICDRYRMSVEIKGGTVPWLAQTIIFTCPWPPEELFKYKDENGNTHDREDILQLIRRIHEVIHVEKTPSTQDDLLAQLNQQTQELHFE